MLLLLLSSLLLTGALEDTGTDGCMWGRGQMRQAQLGAGVGWRVGSPLSLRR